MAVLEFPPVTQYQYMIRTPLSTWNFITLNFRLSFHTIFMNERMQIDVFFSSVVAFIISNE